LSSGFMATPEYQYGKGPINIKVVDPLNVADGYFECKFRDYTTNPSLLGNAADTASWTINRYDVKGGILLESIESNQLISLDNEQLIPQWGVSVQINQTKYFVEVGSGAITSESMLMIIHHRIGYVQEVLMQILLQVILFLQLLLVLKDMKVDFATRMKLVRIQINVGRKFLMERWLLML
jgi:hypothetical protein